MTPRIDELVKELTAGFPLALAFTNPAKRHGLDLKFNDLHQRSVACISEHVLMMVGENENAAETLLRTVEIMPFVTVIAENFISHLVTRNMGCRYLWVESAQAATKT